MADGSVLTPSPATYYAAYGSLRAGLMGVEAVEGGSTEVCEILAVLRFCGFLLPPPFFE